MRRATTLLEMVVVLGIVGIIAGVAATRTARLLDRMRVNGAVTDIVTALAVARNRSIARATYTDVSIDTLAGMVTVSSMGDTVLRRPVADLHDVRVSASRRDLRYAPTGLAYGLSNTTIIVRGSYAADTIRMSRLGRVRR